MKNLILVTCVMLILACSMYGQQPGQYRGTTSQNFPIQFVVNMQGDQLCVDQVGFSVRLTCPSGSEPGWGASFGGCNAVQSDGSFTVTLAPIDGAIPTYVVPGTFPTETTAEGSISFQASHLRVMQKDVDAQLCDSGDVTWTASRTSTPLDELKFESSDVITLRDKDTGNYFTLHKLDNGNN